MAIKHGTTVLTLRWAKNTFHLAVVAACGITASAVMFCVVKHLERSRAEAHFQQVAEQRLSMVGSNVSGALDTMSLLASYFEATGSAGVDRRAFSTFVAPALAKHHYIQALEWIPRVEGPARSQYERLARDDGLHRFSFTEAQGAGAPVVAGTRDEYFPVFYVEPFAGNERALGYNLACNPVRLAALQEARDSGRVVATARVTLVQEKGNQYGFLVFAPVYKRPHPGSLLGRRKALRGFALGVFRIGDFVSISDKNPGAPPRVVVHVFDLAAPESQRQLYPRTPETTAQSLTQGLHEQEEFEVGGRTWLLVATPGPGLHGLPSLAGVVLLFGLLATGIYVLYLQQRIRQSAQIAKSARKLEIAQQRLTEAHRTAQLGSIEQVLGTPLWRIGEEARAMLGLAPTETKGELKVILRNVHSDDLPHLMAVLSTSERDAVANTVDIEFRAEQRVIHALGKAVVSAGTGGLRMLVTLQDITARVQAQEALRRSQERFQLAVRATKDLIWDWDCVTGTVWRNESFWEHCGYGTGNPEPDESAWLELLHPEDRERVWNHFQAVLAQHAESFAAEYRLRRADGSYAILFDRAYIVYGQAGQWARAIGAITDVSERRQLEDQLRQAQKLEAIGQLAAGMAHEINTPIQYVSDNTKFLKDSWPTIQQLLSLAQREHQEATTGRVSPETLASLDHYLKQADLPYLLEEIPRAVEQSLEGAQRVAKIVRAMKDFSHPGSEDKAALDLNRAIETTITVARNEWKYVAELETDLDPNLPPVLGVAGRLNQVILNLLINAAHAIQQVVGDGSRDKGRILVTTRHDQDWVELSVRDTGTGIPEEIRGRIFEPFFTTKPVGQGTGQGLALAHSVIVQEHGGRIWFDSEVGKGTTFFVRLPLAAVEETEREKASPVTRVTDPCEHSVVAAEIVNNGTQLCH
jgi:PAS domain S-box-containing protein